MNISDFTPQSLLFKVIAWVGLAGVVIASLFALANHFESIGYDRRVAEDQIQLNQELAQSATKAQALQSKLNEAQSELSQNKSRLAALNTSNRNNLNLLRGSSTSFNSGLSSNTREALTQRISSLSIVVDDCSTRLIEVANDADTAIAEIQMLSKAWPK